MLSSTTKAEPDRNHIGSSFTAVDTAETCNLSVAWTTEEAAPATRAVCRIFGSGRRDAATPDILVFDDNGAVLRNFTTTRFESVCFSVTRFRTAARTDFRIALDLATALLPTRAFAADFVGLRWRALSVSRAACFFRTCGLLISCFSSLWTAAKAGTEAKDMTKVATSSKPGQRNGEGKCGGRMATVAQNEENDTSLSKARISSKIKNLGRVFQVLNPFAI